MNTKTDQELLTIYDGLPSLLDIATERVEITGGYVYGIQDELREEYRVAGLPFRWSMPFRSVFSCMHCGHGETQVKHVLENPAMKDKDPILHSVELSEENVHEIREHGVVFSAACRRFLAHILSPSE
jgi:hypothetical protein